MGTGVSQPCGCGLNCLGPGGHITHLVPQSASASGPWVRDTARDTARVWRYGRPWIWISQFVSYAGFSLVDQPDILTSSECFILPKFGNETLRSRCHSEFYGNDTEATISSTVYYRLSHVQRSRSGCLLELLHFADSTIIVTMHDNVWILLSSMMCRSLIFTLLIRSGDVELNPGPMTDQG